MKLIQYVVILLFLSAFSANLFAQRVVRIGANSRDAKKVNVQSGVFVICVSKDSSIVPISKLIYANDSILFLRDSSVYIKDLDGLIVYKNGRLVTRIAAAALLAVPTTIPFYVPLTEGTWILYGLSVTTTIPFLVSTINIFRKPMFCDFKKTSVMLKLNLSDEEYAKSLKRYDYYQINLKQQK